MILLSHPNFHNKNIELIVNILLRNEYPLDLIFKNIKKRTLLKFKQFNNLKLDLNRNKEQVQ